MDNFSRYDTAEIREEEAINYDEEYKKITTFESNILKLPVGIHRLMILTEPTKTNYVNERGEKTKQIKMLVKFEDREMTWFVPEGMTEASLYGQLIYIAKKLNGLRGREIEVVVNMTLNKNKEAIRKYEVLGYIKLKQIELQLKKQQEAEDKNMTFGKELHDE